jgi:voltage-gated potassium channel
LTQLDVFRGCSESEIIRIASLITELHVPAGRVLTRADEIGREFFVIADGHAEVRRDGRLITTLGRGSFFGEMALLDGAHRSATVVAATPLDVHVAGEREFHELLRCAPTVAQNMLRTLSRRLRDAA